MDKIEFPYIANLKPHPLNKRLYGRESVDPKLVESIRALGIKQPLIIDADRQILSGHRRWTAAVKLKLEQVPAIYFHGSALEAERVLIDSNEQRVKTAEQRAREFTELKRIEGDLAKERQKLGKGKLPDPAVKGQARDKAAAAVGMSGRTAGRLEKVVEAADAGNPRARAALDAVNTGGMSVAAAHEEVIQPRQSERDSVEKAFREDLRRLSARLDCMARRIELLPRLASDHAVELQDAISRIQGFQKHCVAIKAA